MTFPRPAHSVLFAAIPLQAAPDQKRALSTAWTPCRAVLFLSNRPGCSPHSSAPGREAATVLAAISPAIPVAAFHSAVRIEP